MKTNSDIDGEELQAPKTPPSRSGRLRRISRRFVEQPTFDYAIGVVIFFNSLLIGWQASVELHEGIPGELPAFFVILEHVFLVVYTLELLLRFVAYGWKCFTMGWVLFDMVLVALGTVNEWILLPLRIGQTESFQLIMIFRTFRLLRLIRALRLISHFRIVWRLAQGLMNSAGTMLSTLLLIVTMLYVYACIGLEIITKNKALLESPAGDIIEERFYNLFETMLTLVQFVTLDSAAGIYQPLIYEQPWSLAPYFLSLILIVSISLMNLITATLVESAMTLSSMDGEMQRAFMKRRVRELIPEIRSAFEKIDTDHSGTLTRDEVELLRDELPKSVLEVVRTEQLLQIFDILDIDGSGYIEEEEFVDGVLHLALADVPVETTQMLKLIRIIRTKVETVDSSVRQLRETFGVSNLSPVSKVASKQSLPPTLVNNP